MPELPEVEAVCRKLRLALIGAEILSAHVLRPSVARPQQPEEIESRVTGQIVQGVRRRGKNILLDLSRGDTLHVHLRMTGNLYVVGDVRFRSAATRAYFELTDGRGLIFQDSRLLGKMHVYKTDEIARVLVNLGMEPLDKSFTPDWFINRARASRKPAKIFLMDQSHVAGLGNIYAAEALFHARIHPAKPIGNLRKAKLQELHGGIVGLLEAAVESAYNAYATPGQFSEGAFFPCAVYDREGERCAVCQRMIRRIQQGGRSTFYCPGCQR